MEKVAPFKSKAQARFMYARHPEMAKRWAKHTPSIKALPEKKAMLIEKLAVFGRQAQRAVSQTFRRRLIPREAMEKLPFLKEIGFAGISPTVRKDIASLTKQQRAMAELTSPLEALTQVAGKTVQPPSGGVAGVLRRAAEMGASTSQRRRLNQKLKALTPSDKRVLRSVIAGHELAELGAAGVRKSRSKALAHRGHLSPAVLLDESSRVSALTPAQSRVKDVMQYMRKMTGEEAEIRQVIPGYKHGVSRFNRTQRRRWTEVFDRRRAEEEKVFRKIMRDRKAKAIGAAEKRRLIHGKPPARLKKAKRLAAVAAGMKSPTRLKAIKKVTPRAVSSDIFK